MAKKRYILDSIWTDIWFEDLKPKEKLLFMYLLTNPLMSICWIYEVSLKKINYDTWIEKKEILNIFSIFEENKKVYYKNWIVVIVNFVRNQNLTSEKDKLWLWVKRELKDNGSTKLKSILPYKDLISSLKDVYKDLAIPYLTLLNLTLLNSTEISVPISEIIPEEIIDDINHNNEYNNYINNNRTITSIILKTFLDLWYNWKESIEEFKKWIKSRIIDIYKLDSLDQIQNIMNWFYDYWIEQKTSKKVIWKSKLTNSYMIKNLPLKKQLW